MPELDLGQPGFTYSSCGLFTKHPERIQIFKEIRYKNKLYKAFFTQDEAYSDSKDLVKKTIWSKIWKTGMVKLLYFQKAMGANVNDQV